MIAKTELIKKVKYHFSLNIYESKVWIALLNKTIATVGEIAEISGVPRSRVYDVLESLEKRGFAIAKLGKPVRYIAVKPSVVIEHMKNNMLRNAEERAKNLTTMKDSVEYRELEVLHSKGIKPIQPEDLSSAIKGRQNIYSHIKDLLGGAEKEIIFISTSDALKRKAHFLKPILKKLKNQGVTVNIAASAKNPGDEKEKLNLISLSKELGVPIRRIKINARFCIVDGSKLLIFITPDSDVEGDIAIWINSPFFGKALTTFLSPVWRISRAR
ncbi:MAG: TrmB family transcriptional regulator [Candidatus Pacearchaeota archaeon]|nr:MAG: TrmB family transcriptional regulator [Candidatus Pacearchaeota archaeon]